MLRHLGLSVGKFRELLPSTAPSVLRRTLSQSGGRPAVSGMPGDVRVNEADRVALRQHSNEVMVRRRGAEGCARQDRPADEEARPTTTSTRRTRRRRAICSIFHGLVEEATWVQVSCSCGVHLRLGFCEDALLRARTFGEAHQVTCPNPARGASRGGYTPPSPTDSRSRQVDAQDGRTRAQGQRSRAVPPKKGAHHPRSGGLIAQCHRARGGRPPRRMTWNDPSATSSSVVGSVAGIWRMTLCLLLVTGSPTAGVP